MDAIKNFAEVTVSTGYDGSATSIALTSGHGAKLPAPATEGAFNLVWWNSTDYPNPSDDPNVEIVRCTARSTDTLTVTRAQESTSASTKNTSAKTYKMMLSVTQKTVMDLVSFLCMSPEGTMFNGRLAVSVVSNDLVVALKTFAGTDPSAFDPVYVVIGGVVRSITAALSVTLADGTNWMNLGSSELATKEADLFAFLFFKASDSSIVLGISRIPYGTVYSTFSSTSTNEKYIGVSATPASTDTCVNIGRFACTLSAGAGYTWTVPTFTAVNLIQRPIYETRDLAWAPVYSAGGSMTYTSVTTNIALYRISGSQVFINHESVGTVGGSVDNHIKFSLPIALGSSYNSGAYVPVLASQVNNGTSQLAGMSLKDSASVIGVRIYNIANWSTGSGRYIASTGVYSLT